MPETDTRVWRTLSRWGTSIADQGRFDEAEPLLIESAEWILENAPTIEGDAEDLDRHRAEIYRRIIQMYEKWHEVEPGAGYDSSANEWRTEQQSIGSE